MRLVVEFDSVALSLRSLLWWSRWWWWSRLWWWSRWWWSRSFLSLYSFWCLDFLACWWCVDCVIILNMLWPVSVYSSVSLDVLLLVYPRHVGSLNFNIGISKNINVEFDSYIRQLGFYSIQTVIIVFLNKYDHRKQEHTRSLTRHLKIWLRLYALDLSCVLAKITILNSFWFCYCFLCGFISPIALLWLNTFNFT